VSLALYDGACLAVDAPVRRFFCGFAACSLTRSLVGGACCRLFLCRSVALFAERRASVNFFSAGFASLSVGGSGSSQECDPGGLPDVCLQCPPPPVRLLRQSALALWVAASSFRITVRFWPGMSLPPTRGRGNLRAYVRRARPVRPLLDRCNVMFFWLFFPVRSY